MSWMGKALTVVPARLTVFFILEKCVNFDEDTREDGPTLPNSLVKYKYLLESRRQDIYTCEYIMSSHH